MKKRVIKWSFLALLITATLMVVVPVGATTISDLQKKQEELKKKQEELKKIQEEEQKKLNEVSGNISGLEDEAEVIADDIRELDESVIMIMASVDMIAEDIIEKEEHIVITEAEYEEAKAIEEAQYIAMTLRLKHMYETPDTPYLEVLFEASSLSDMLNRMEYMEKLNEYDSLQLDAYIKAKEDVAALKEQLEDEKAALEAQKHELEDEQKELERIITEKQEEYENFEVLIAKARQQAAIYRANVKSKSDEINKLAREQAAVRAQEIAAVKAAEEAKRAAAAGNTSLAGGNYLPPSGFSGSTGDRIASYACQFVGNPYVAGGTSLTNGADCSGFVWRVYRDFGYTTPRTSWSFREAGTGVEYSDAKPGDVICYAGHVGIYIGNGRIVHASTERTGITITPATYKTILAVRRLV